MLGLGCCTGFPSLRWAGPQGLQRAGFSSQEASLAAELELLATRASGAVASRLQSTTLVVEAHMLGWSGMWDLQGSNPCLLHWQAGSLPPSHHFLANSWGNSSWLYFGGSKITADGDCTHEIKRRLLFGRKVMTNLDSRLKSRDITLSTEVI